MSAKPPLGSHARCGGGRADRGCGKAIQWGVQPDGSRVPLDPSCPVYEVVGIRSNGELNVRPLELEDLNAHARHLVPAAGAPYRGPIRGRRVMVGHFVACPRSRQSPPARKAG